MSDIKKLYCDVFPDEFVLKTVLKNGFSIYVYPMPLKQNVYALLGADIGAVNRAFSLGGRRIDVPSGTAHFLEHKMFESENGDAFELFAKTGASANAYTSFERTCYLFSSSINVPQSLETLLSFVADPYFTVKSVKKEQGIIAQEIKMYDDSPEWQLALSLLQNMYVSHPIREDIAGSIESIAQITPDLLYDCYNAFYRPERMALCVAGNIEPETVLEIADKIYGSKKNVGGAVERFYVAEPERVFNKTSSLTMDISMPQFGLGFKHKSTASDKKAQMIIASRMLMSLLAGETTDFYQNLYDKGLLNEAFDASMMDGFDYCCTAFSGESSQPEMTAELVRKEIKNAQKKGFNSDRFEELRCSLIGSEICAFDSPESVATRMMEAHFRGYSIFDAFDIAKTLKITDVEQLLDEFDDERSTLSIMRPKA